MSVPVYTPPELGEFVCDAMLGGVADVQMGKLLVTSSSVERLVGFTQFSGQSIIVHAKINGMISFHLEDDIRIFSLNAIMDSLEELQALIPRYVPRKTGYLQNFILQNSYITVGSEGHSIIFHIFWIKPAQYPEIIEGAESGASNYLGALSAAAIQVLTKNIIIQIQKARVVLIISLADPNSSSAIKHVASIRNGMTWRLNAIGLGSRISIAGGKAQIQVGPVGATFRLP